MAWQLGELLSEATQITGAVTGFPTSRYSQLANQAMRDIAARLPHVELEDVVTGSTTTSSAQATLPSDCEVIINLSFDTSVAGVGGRSIRQAAPWELDAKSDGTEQGVPRMYVSWQTFVEFYPSPDSAYSLLMRYRKRVSDITSLTARSSLDTRYDQALLYKTVEYLHLRKGEYDKVAQARALYEAELRTIPNYYTQKQQNRAGMGLRVQTEED